MPSTPAEGGAGGPRAPGPQGMVSKAGQHRGESQLCLSLVGSSLVSYATSFSLCLLTLDLGYYEDQLKRFVAGNK